MEAKAAFCFLLLLHSTVPVLNRLSWQLAHRCPSTFVSRSKGVVLFPGKFLGCEDEATKADTIPSSATAGVSVMSWGSSLSRNACILCPYHSRFEILVSPAGRCFFLLSPEERIVSLLLPGDGLGPEPCTPQQSLLFLSCPSLSGPGW